MLDEAEARLTKAGAMKAIGQRGLVYDRLKKLAPAPAGVTKEGILKLDQSMLDSWWNALGFDDISVWRHWEHSWTPAPAGTK